MLRDENRKISELTSDPIKFARYIEDLTVRRIRLTGPLHGVRTNNRRMKIPK